MRKKIETENMHFPPLVQLIYRTYRNKHTFNGKDCNIPPVNFKKKNYVNKHYDNVFYHYFGCAVVRKTHYRFMGNF